MPAKFTFLAIVGLTLWCPPDSLWARARGDALLADAAKRQDRSAIRALLAKHADVNAPLSDGSTALLWMSQWNDLETAALLTGAGANVHAANDYGVTPLAMAATNGSAEMIRLLLQAGANPNGALPSGETVLMTAVRTGRLAAVHLLLAAGANVNVHEGIKGQTPLMWAIADGHFDCVSALLDRGADVTARSTAGYTPLHFAARMNADEVVRLLLARGADLNATAGDGTSVLLMATVRGHIDLAKALLEKGANAKEDRAGYTALHWAAGNWESATSINFGPEGSEIGLMAGLTKARKIEMIEALLRHGSDINAQITKPPPLGRFGATVGAGAVIGGGQLTGATPFFLAALGGDPEVMRFLVANGANPLMPAKDGTTPLMAAAGTTGFELETSLPESAHLSAVKVAVDAGGDVHAVNALGNTALHIAAHAGYNSVVQFLVDKGAAINQKNKAGQTPRRIADGVVVILMRYERPHTAELLRSLGGTLD